MRDWRPRVSLLLAALLLVTVLAPDFGWDRAESYAMHSDHLDRSEPATGDSNPGEKSDHDGLGCAGHSFGHLAAIPPRDAWLATCSAPGAYADFCNSDRALDSLCSIDRPPSRIPA